MKSYGVINQLKAIEQFNPIFSGSYGVTIQETLLSLTGDFGQVKLEQYRKRNNFLL